MLAIFSTMDSITLYSDRQPIYFLADLHLDPARPEAIRAFLQFLAGPATTAGAIFILGDLFEAWIGDDARPQDDPIAPALAQLSITGTAIFLMHGNRDFLLGADFAKAAGARILDEPTVINIDDERVLLEHGDALCTDDTAYQAFRQQVRNPDWQATFLSLSIDERIQQAQAARLKSGEAMADKRSEIMDVNAQAVAARMRAHQVTRLIHGHTHRPDIHHFDLDGQAVSRIVLGDWFEQGSLLLVDAGDYSLQTLAFAKAKDAGQSPSP